MRAFEIEQRSPEWYELRRGVITASNAERLLTGAKQKTYAQELLVDILTEGAEERFVNDAMQWGIDNEANACMWYEMQSNDIVKPIGFCLHDDHDEYGCSPDGLINDDGLIEIKCPSSRVHLEYLESGPPAKYIAQMNWQMYITGRSYCIFVSYDPRFQEELQGCSYRIERDDTYIEKLSSGAKKVVEHIAKYKDKVLNSF